MKPRVVWANEWFRIWPSRIQGYGACATRPIPAGTVVAEYQGERISKAESARRCAAGNPFIFHLNDEVDIDGSVPENLARFLNHSCAPNAEVEWREEGIWIVTVAPVAEGEEITFNYRYDLEDYRSHPCKCGAKECVGYMVAPEFFELVRRQNEARGTEASVPGPS